MFDALRNALSPTPTDEDRVKAARNEQMAVEAVAGWEERLSHPAHEYISQCLERVGLPADIAQVEGRRCSFWAQRQADIYGIPYVARAGCLSVIGGELYLYVDLGSDSSKIHFTKDGKGILWTNDNATPIHSFQLL